MRPNALPTRDTLRVSTLPPSHGAELDYRTELLSRGDRGDKTLHFLAVILVVTLVLVIMARVAGLYLRSVLVLAILLVVSLFFAVREFQSTQRVPRALGMLAVGPLIWLGCVVAHSTLKFVAVVPVLVVALNLAHDLVMHRGLWMCAHPFLKPPVRRRWKAMWKRPWWIGVCEVLIRQRTTRRDPAYAFRQVEGIERDEYAIHFAAVLAAFACAVFVFVLFRRSFLSGLMAYGLFVALTFSYGAWRARQYLPTACCRVVINEVWEAVIAWFTYNLHDTCAPGVFQSPSGSARTRIFRAQTIAALAAYVFLPAAHYLPVGVIFFGDEPWHKAIREPAPWDNLPHAWGQLQALFHSVDSNAHKLTPEELAYLRQLPQEQRAAIEPKLRYRESVFTRLLRLLTQFPQQKAPERSLLLYVRGAAQGNAPLILSFVLSMIACLLAPPLAIAAMVFAIGARPLIHFHTTLGTEDDDIASYHNTLNPNRNLWNAYVRRIRRSRCETEDDQGNIIRESDHLLLGFSTEEDYPVLLHKDILREHAHLTGDSGSGKTSLGFCNLITQLIGRPNTSVVVIDMRPEMYLFQAAQNAVQSANQRKCFSSSPIPFKWFTNTPGFSTFAFNPFLQSDLAGITVHQRVEVIMKSLGLEYGEGYGPSFYASVNRDVMTKLIDREGIDFQSFRDLAEEIRDVLPQMKKGLNIGFREQQEAIHLFNEIRSLAYVDALNITRERNGTPDVMENMIDMSQIVRSPQVAYFGLNSSFEEATVRSVAKLVLYTLLLAAVRRGQSNHQVYVLVDEFAQLVSRDLEMVIRLARGAGIGLIFANQTLSDLKTKHADLAPTVQANTRFKQVFAATDVQHQDMLIKASGDVLYHFQSWSERDDGAIAVDAFGRGFVKVTEHMNSRLLRNDIIEVSDHPLCSFAQIARGHGFSQFGGHLFPIRSMHHVDRETYLHWRGVGWPPPTQAKGLFTSSLDEQWRATQSLADSSSRSGPSGARRRIADSDEGRSNIHTLDNMELE